MRKVSDDSVAGWTNTFAQPLAAGKPAQASVRLDGTMELRNRSGRRMGLGGFYGALLRERVASDLVLDGIACCCGRVLSYAVMDCILDVPFDVRLSRLEKAFRGLEPADSVWLVPPVMVACKNDLRVCESSFLADGYAGMILRQGRDGYKPLEEAGKLTMFADFPVEELLAVDWKVLNKQLIITCEKGQSLVDALACRALTERLRGVAQAASMPAGCTAHVKCRKGIDGVDGDSAVPVVVALEGYDGG
jgi:hypothetical protein